MTQSSIYNEQAKEDIRRIELELTSICNLNCPLCFRERTELPNNFRMYDEIVEQLEQYPNLEFVTIAGAVSEPTSHPQLFDILTYLRKRDIEVSLYINGDTKNDMYYIKLGFIFHGMKGNVYFTICGSTQELHSKYRVGSKLSRVLRRADLVKRYTDNVVLTWLVFEYNRDDFNDNYAEYKLKYNTEYFHTIPFSEHFELENDNGIHLPNNLHKLYLDKIDRLDYNISCPANKNDFVQITYDGNVVPCSLYRLYGEEHCFECSNKNTELLRSNQIFNVAEPESEVSEIPIRLHYDHK